MSPRRMVRAAAARSARPPHGPRGRRTVHVAIAELSTAPIRCLADQWPACLPCGPPAVPVPLGLCGCVVARHSGVNFARVHCEVHGLHLLVHRARSRFRSITLVVALSLVTSAGQGALLFGGRGRGGGLRIRAPWIWRRVSVPIRSNAVLHAHLPSHPESIQVLHLIGPPRPGGGPA